MQQFTLSNVSEPLLQKMFDKLRTGGNTVSTLQQDNYTVIGSGITAQVVYDAAAQQATVTILSKPWIVPASLIEGRVREALAVASRAV